MSLRFTISIVFFLSVCGCRKEKLETVAEPEPMHTEIREGLPENLDKLNGYFFYGRRISPHLRSAWYARAFFSVNGGPLRESDLHADLLVGDVWADHKKMNVAQLATLSTYYVVGEFIEDSFPVVDKERFVWRIEENSSTPADSFVFYGVQPEIKLGGHLWLTANPDTSFSLDINLILGNYSEAQATFITIERNVPQFVHLQQLRPDFPVYRLSRGPVKGLLLYYGQPREGWFRIHAQRYFHKFHHGKLYLFSFSAEIDARVHLPQ